MATGDGDGDGDGKEDDDPEFPDAWPIRSSETSSVGDRLPVLFEFLPHELIRPRPSSQRKQFFPEIPAPSLPRRSPQTSFADRPPPFAFLPHELIPHRLSWPPKKSFPEIPTPSLPRRSSQTHTVDRPIPLSLLPKNLIPPPLLSPPKKSLPQLPVTLCNPNFRVPVPRNLPPGPWDPAEICPALSDLRISGEAENLPDYISDWEGPPKLGNCSFHRQRDRGAPEPNPTYGRRSGGSSRQKRGAGRAANQRSGLDEQPIFHY